MQKIEYLKETKMLDFSSPAIQRLIENRAWKTLPEAERAKAIYNFVKDEILFGYNVDDNVIASRVLKDGYGQCNTKGTLFMALLRACGISCRIHGFTIDKILQKGAMSGFVYKSAPKEIFHSFVEAFVCGQWYELEGLSSTEITLRRCSGCFTPKKTVRLSATAWRSAIFSIRPLSSIAATPTYKKRALCAISACMTPPIRYFRNTVRR